MKKVTAFALALLFACGLLLTGCHGSKEKLSFEIPDGFDESRKYEITFWAKNDTNVTQVNIYKDAVEKFQSLYPNITVNIRFYTDYGRIYSDVITNIATGTTPNVCITYPDHIATYLTGSEVIVPLDELLTDSRYGLGGSEVKFDAPKKEEIIPKFMNECFMNGHYYALPYMRSTEACYINKDYVEKLGYTVPDILTWDWIWEVSEAAAVKDEKGIYPVNGQKVMIPFIYKSTDNMMITMLKQLGAGYSDDSGSIEMFNEDTKKILYTVSEHTKSGAFSTFKISSYPANFLNAGQCIFAIDSTAGATWMGSDAPLLDIPKNQLVPFETVVRMIPQFDPEKPYMISQGPSVCIFNKEDPQEVMASWLFLQFLLTNDVQNAYSKTEGYVPVTIKAQSDPAYQEYLEKGGTDNAEHYKVKIDAAKLLIANTDNTFVTPVFNGSASLRDAAGQLIENTAKATRRKQTVDDDFMEKQFADVTSLFHLDQISAESSEGKKPLGPLPSTSVVLLITLGAVWVLILVYVLIEQLKKKKEKM